ncbi:MAG: formylglycine-generating enzyme family protein [Planctomycetes bacterium]|nr:formylglycine-generating enzyme family protein [Planctomycetota bacterium]
MEKSLLWLEEWRRNVGAVKAASDWREYHRWLWNSWAGVGRQVAQELNQILGLSGPEVGLQPDFPCPLIGDLERAKILFVNINPGWNPNINPKEDLIVRTSEQDSWEFFRNFFTRFPAEVGPNRWWAANLEYAWRIVEESRPSRLNEWANHHVAAIELFPLHSASAKFLIGKARHPDQIQVLKALEAGRRETLLAAVRNRAPVTIVASSGGAKFVHEAASDQGWDLPIRLSSAPPRSSAYVVDECAIAAVPQPLNYRWNPLSEEQVAKWIREIGDRNKHDVGQKTLPVRRVLEADRMEFVLVTPGEFQMGSPDHELARDQSEDQVWVQLTKPFRLGTTVVTRAQWFAVMNSVPWKENVTYIDSDRTDIPATEVSWDDAQEYCRRLGQMHGRKYRLPTEAEWEFACRAGTTTRFSFGNEESVLTDYAWFGEKLNAQPHPVGQKKPNPIGLFDMHGNVSEWCEDDYVGYPRTLPGGTDPVVRNVGSARSLRGGAYSSKSGQCRSASRARRDHHQRLKYVGFRIAFDSA